MENMCGHMDVPALFDINTCFSLPVEYVLALAENHQAICQYWNENSWTAVNFSSSDSSSTAMVLR